MLGGAERLLSGCCLLLTLDPSFDVESTLMRWLSSHADRLHAFPSLAFPAFRSFETSSPLFLRPQQPRLDSMSLIPYTEPKRPSHYAILQVPRNATEEDVRVAYLRAVSTAPLLWRLFDLQRSVS